MNTTTANATLTLNEGYLSRRTWGDWLFALLAAAGALFAFQQYHAAMDGYDQPILAGKQVQLRPHKRLQRSARIHGRQHIQARQQGSGVRQWRSAQQLSR